VDLDHQDTQSRSRLEQCSIAQSSTYSEHFDDETLIYIDSGEFLFQSVSAKIPAGPGSLVYVRPGELLIRCNINDGPANIVIISFDSNMLRQFTPRHCDLIAQIPRTHQPLPDAFEVQAFPLLAQSLEHLFALGNISHPQDILELRMEELLILLLMSDHSQIIASVIRNKTHRTSDKLRAFMDQHFKNDWKLEEFAKEFGASLTTFKETFSEVFGMSPRAWISERRLLYSHQLLLSSELSIVDVAAESSFSSQSYFTQSYKRRFGETPSQTRKRAFETKDTIWAAPNNIGIDAIER
jgi:AraC-like DNA-binding protein